MRWSRRSFLAAAAAAAVAAACRDDEEQAAEPADDAGGFGVEIDIGTLDRVVTGIEDGNGFLYVPEARAWIVTYPAAALEAAAEVYDDTTLAGMEAGFVALSQRCTHLGCRLPQCESSKRFECPCHHAVFNRVGELVAGPATRGMDRYPIRVEDGRVLVDTSVVIEGTAEGVSTVTGDPAGPTCIGAT